MLLLNVPYSEKDEAKALGAYWNPTLKRWYVKDRTCFHRFARWILPYGDTIVCDRLYIVEGCQKCFKCGRETRVIGYGLEHFMELEDDGDDISYDWNDEEIRITEINNEYVPVLSPVISYVFCKPLLDKVAKKNGQPCMSKKDNVATGLPGIL